MTMLMFAGLFAALWILQMILNWKQAKRFMAAVAELRDAGDVVTGRHKRRGRRTYAAIAIKDDHVTGSRILKGISVFARPKPSPGLIGLSVDDLVAGTVDGVDPRVAAAAAHAATLYLEHRRSNAHATTSH